MKKRHMPGMSEGSVNVTPLIDIVMVLIVFFMLIAKIGVTRGEDSSIPLPSAVLGKKIESLTGTLTLNVHGNRNGDEPMLDSLIGESKRELHVSKLYNSGNDQ